MAFLIPTQKEDSTVSEGPDASINSTDYGSGHLYFNDVDGSKNIVSFITLNSKKGDPLSKVPEALHPRIQSQHRGRNTGEREQIGFQVSEFPVPEC